MRHRFANAVTVVGRPVFILATVALASFALLQSAGRLAFGQLHRFEDTVNEMLADRGLRVQGISGRWRGLNPGIHVDHVTFAAGEGADVTFELDLVESLLHNQFIAHRLTIAKARLALERTEAGWQLQGATGQAEIDWQAFVRYSDQLAMSAAIQLHGGDLSTAVLVDARLINTDRRHRFHVEVSASEASFAEANARSGPSVEHPPRTQCDGCTLTIAGDITANGAGAVHVQGERLQLPAALVGGLGFNADGSVTFGVDAKWKRTPEGQERARLHADVLASGLARPVRLGLDAAGWNDGDANYRGRIESLSLTGGGRSFRVNQGGFLASADLASATVWLPPWSIERLAPPLLLAFGTEHTFGRHLTHLSPRGRVSDFAIHLDGAGVALQAKVSEASMTGYKGIPEVANATFTLAGAGNGLRARFDSPGTWLGFPAYLSANDQLDHGTGTFTVWYRNRRLGIRTSDLVLRKGRTTTTGAFALVRGPGGPSYVATDGRVDQVGIEMARAYVPNTLSAAFREWFDKSVQSGSLRDTRIVYQGRTTTDGDLPLRRFEMATAFVDGTVDYLADWPMATDLAGTVTVTADGTRVQGRGAAFGVDMPQLDVQVAHALASPGAQGPDFATVALRCTTKLDVLFDFARTTPLRDSLPFLAPSWSGSGPVAVAATLRVPLTDAVDTAVDAEFRFDGAELNLADLGLRFSELEGTVRVQTPYNVTAPEMHASLFGEPVTVNIASDAQSMQFNITGSATPGDIYTLMNMRDIGIAAGTFAYSARATVFPASDRAIEVAVESDLLGTAVDLPPPLAKAPNEARSLTAVMQFLDTHVATSARYGELDGWLHSADGQVLTGAVGIATAPPLIDVGTDRVVLSGRLDAVAGDVIAQLVAEGGGAMPFALELRKFEIGELHAESFVIHHLQLDGEADDDRIQLELLAEELSGTIDKTGDAPWQLHLQTLRLEADDSDDDPLDAAIIDRLVAADVTIERMYVGGEDFGSWRLGLRPNDDGVALVELVAEVRGLRIESSGPAHWSRKGQSSFTGIVEATNLEDVLPLWDFAPSVESERFHVVGELHWPGSPVNFELAHLSGDATLRVENGRFLDIAPSATPILSLINFSTIVRRMSLDFSDVFGAGVSFETVTAKVSVDDGLARFDSPGEIVGTGSSFQVVGTVDLESGALDNEIVVTLPLHNSLPWYAAFLALSNPAGAAAVVFSRQILKAQIRRLTSGKYHIGGTYDEPEVEFVGIFADDVEVPPTGEPGTSNDDGSAGHGLETANGHTTQTTATL